MASGSPIRLVVSGCCGRMGSLIIEEALKDPSFDLVGAIEHTGHSNLGKPLSKLPTITISADMRQALKNADVLIEFTTPEATVTNAEIAASVGVPIVIGTTGLSEAQRGKIVDLAKKIPIFKSPNMSIGILILNRMIAEAVSVLKTFGLDKKTKVKIWEAHHALKKDKPSGTAKFLQANTANCLNINPEDIVMEEPDRKEDIVGIHRETISFGEEYVELKHEAQTREVFARGALVIAIFLVEHLHDRPGHYDMDTFYQFIVNAQSGRETTLWAKFAAWWKGPRRKA